MFGGFLRIGAGSLLVLVFLVLVLVLASSRNIRAEPRGVLVIMLALLGLIIACVFITSTVTDMVAGPLAFCHSVMTFGMGAVVAFKMTSLFLAFDQFVAVLHCLYYDIIMEDWIRRMAGMVCGCVLFFWMFGLACFHFEMESTSEFYHRVFGADNHPTHCSWKQMPNIYTATAEVTVLVLVTVTCSLALYTAVLGLRYEKCITQREDVQETRRFITSYKSFKQIVKVLLVLFTVDIVGRVVRIVSFWFPLSIAVTLFQLLNFIGFIIECWTYGLGHVTVRAQIRRYLCRHRGNPPTATIQQPTELPLNQQPAELPPNQQPTELPPNQQPAELPPIKQPAELPPIKQSAELPPIKQPAELPPIKQPAELPPNQQPAELPPNQQPAELPPIKQPAKLPPNQQPAELSPNQQPAELPPIKQPAELPPIKQPAELPLIQQPEELPPNQQPVELPPIQRPEEFTSIQPAL